MILVTGATGLLGSALIKELDERGIKKIRILKQYGDTQEVKVKVEENLSIEIESVYGDVRDLDSLIKAMDGISEVYHCASFISIVPGIYDMLYSINVIGVENIIKAAHKMGVSRVLYVSSVEAIGYKQGEESIDESAGFRPDCCLIQYGKSKAIGAIKGLALAKELGLDLVIVAPAGIYGPYDYRNSRVGKMLYDASSGKLPLYIEGSFDFVDSRDVASLCYLAMKNGKTYETYIGNGHHNSLKNLLEYAVENANAEYADSAPGHKKVKMPPKLPLNIALCVGFIFEIGYKIFGGQPLVTRESINILRYGIKYSSKKAQEELGWKIRDAGDSIRDTYNWYKKNFKKMKGWSKLTKKELRTIFRWQKQQGLTKTEIH